MVPLTMISSSGPMLGLPIYRTQVESDHRHSLHTELMLAIEQQQFTVHYQPILELQSGRISRCEALIRWQMPNGTVHYPDEFITIAEQTGLIKTIDNLVMDIVLKDMERINADLSSNLQVSLNRSMHEFHHIRDQVPGWIQTLIDHPLHHLVVIEITENLLLDMGELVQESLAILQKNGVQISIDDFGTGYSSINYLKRFPVDQIKIDKSFIDDIAHDKVSFALVKSLTAIAEVLGISVVAEGVETQEQLAQIETLYCDYAQGYLFSKPVTVNELIQLLKEKH